MLNFYLESEKISLSDDESGSSLSSIESSKEIPENKELVKEIDDAEKRNRMLYGGKLAQRTDSYVNNLSSIATIPKLTDEESKQLETSIHSMKDSSTNLELNTPNYNNPQPSLSEEQLEILREEERQRRQKQLRYEHRKNADKFLNKILTLEIFTLTSEKLNRVPHNFPNYIEYMQTWTPLFEYE